MRTEPALGLDPGDGLRAPCRSTSTKATSRPPVAVILRPGKTPDEAAVALVGAAKSSTASTR